MTNPVISFLICSTIPPTFVHITGRLNSLAISITPLWDASIYGNTIKLASAPASGSDYFVVVIGATVNIGTPSNNTVTSDHIVDGSIVNADVSNSAAIATSKLSGAGTIEPCFERTIYPRVLSPSSAAEEECSVGKSVRLPAK